MKKLLLITLALVFFSPFSFVSAQEVDLLWQGDGYTQPFYKGRTLWSNQSRVTLLAIPQGLGNASSLNYKWTKNGTVLGSLSGIGKGSLSFPDPGLSRQQNVRVDIISDDNVSIANASIVLTPIAPTLVIYENNPLYGIAFHREIGSEYNLQSEEVTFSAFPMFFSTINRMSNTLSYEWRTNTGNASSGSTATYRIPEDATGSSLVQVNAKSQDKILQDSMKSFTVKFGD